MKRKYPIVISIAAVSGGGKTTIASFLLVVWSVIMTVGSVYGLQYINWI